MTRTKFFVWAILLAIGLPILFPGETRSIFENVSDAIARAKEPALPAQGAPPVDLEPGRALAAIPVQPTYRPVPVAFSTDGKSVAVNWEEDAKSLVGLFDAASGKSLWQVDLGDSEGCGIAFTPDGQSLAVGSSAGIKLLEIKTGVERSIFGEVGMNRARLAYSLDGKKLAAVGDVPFLEVWDTTSGKQVYNGHVGTRELLGLAVAPDGLSFATCGSGPMRCRPFGLFGSGFACGTKGGRVWISQPDLAEEPREFETRGRVFAVAFAPDGRTLASASFDGVQLWNLATGKGRRIIDAEAHSLAYAPDGRTLAVGIGINNNAPTIPSEIRLFDLATLRSPSVLRGNLGTVGSLAFAPDRKTLVASGPKGVALWDLAPGATGSVLLPRVP